MTHEPMKTQTKVEEIEVRNDINYQYKMTNGEAADYLGISPNTLNSWRSRKSYAITYYKVGSKVYYAQSDLDQFLLSRRISIKS